jgi:hypothetical protein
MYVFVKSCISHSCRESNHDLLDVQVVAWSVYWLYYHTFVLDVVSSNFCPDIKCWLGFLMVAISPATQIPRLCQIKTASSHPY